MNRLLLPLTAAALLAACATPRPPADAPPARLGAQWLAPQDAGTALPAQWWRALGDESLDALIAQAWAHSPSLAQVRARLAQAQAAREAAGAALAPRLQAQAQAARGTQAPPFEAVTQGQWTLAAGWELDLWGSQRAQAAAAGVRVQAAELSLAQAHTSLALEVAQAALAWRHAQGQVLLAARDVALAERDALADQQLAQAGLLSLAEAALAQTRAAAARSAQAQWQEQQAGWLQALALLTADEAGALAARLARVPQPLPAAPALRVDSLPATLLGRRADLAAAHRLWQAAALEAQGQALAQHAPQLRFDALVGRSRWQLSPTLSGTVWSLAPSLSLPLFDAGARRAQTAAAQAQEQEARAALEQQWRAAVAEVEQALLRWQAASTQRREAEATALHWQRVAEAGALQARQGRLSVQVADRDERAALAARSLALDAAREHTAAWLQLVRALGGGWQASAVS